MKFNIVSTEQNCTIDVKSLKNGNLVAYLILKTPANAGGHVQIIVVPGEFREFDDAYAAARAHFLSHIKGAESQLVTVSGTVANDTSI